MITIERSMDSNVLDDIIRRLLEGKGGKQVQLSEGEIRQLCVNARNAFLSQPNLLDVRAPIRLCVVISTKALNSNNFTGGIPPSLGNLTKLYWLDLADNKLTDSIHVSIDFTPGLDQLLHVKHFHFNKNKLSGTIPPQLFRPEMILIHMIY